MDISTSSMRWSLNDLLPDGQDQALDQHLAQLEQSVTSLETYRTSLTPDVPIQTFLDILQTYESMARLAAKLKAYAYLWFSENTQNPAALNLRGRLEHLLTAVQNRTLFFSLWFKALPDADAARLIKGSGDLRYFLESLRRFKPFTLSEAEEKLINVKDTNGIDALVKVYDMLTNGFSYHLDVAGERKVLTRDQLASYTRSPSAETRAAAYREMFRVYTDNSLVLAQIYSHRVRDWGAEALDLRGYAQPISYRNLVNDLPDSVVDTLLAVCRQNTAIFHRYFRLKARFLGLDKLRRYDVYAPFTTSAKQYTYSEAASMVLASLQAFSPLLEAHAKRVLDAKHLDAEPRPGKRGGAFCYGVLPELTPWVLVNFTGNARDVATLAHELGHAVHAGLAGSHSVLTFSPSLPMAETASVFSEMLLSERLLQEETDPDLRRDILARSIDDAYVTIMRQAYFSVFERDAHRLVAEGKTFDDVAACYMANLHELFGDTMDIADEFRWEWISVPHIYNTPFYTYAYTFGQLLVLALYQQYKAEGEAFVPRYVRILSAGGSESPIAVLKDAGCDITSPAFWQGGFAVIGRLIDQLEELI